MILEPMSDFFAARVSGYDEHMINEVEGCKEGYNIMASLVPADTHELLDLGCGTGLELGGIFKVLPEVRVTGIDLCREMLERLKEKYSDKNITLICGDYFAADLGSERFNCAVSFQTMHHFSHEAKTGLYKKIHRALTDGGVYIECDYTAENQTEEDLYYAENARLRRELGIPEGTFYHYDTPCTRENQIIMLKEAGFASAEVVWSMGYTVMFVSKK